MQRNHLIQATDVAFADEFGARLDRTEHHELQSAMNVNTSDEAEEWFDEEIPVAHVTEITEEEFFQRYFPEVDQ